MSRPAYMCQIQHDRCAASHRAGATVQQQVCIVVRFGTVKGALKNFSCCVSGFSSPASCHVLSEQHHAGTFSVRCRNDVMITFSTKTYCTCLCLQDSHHLDGVMHGMKSLIAMACMGHPEGLQENILVKAASHEHAPQI